MAFTLEQALNDFFDNSGGGGIAYGGTGTGGTVTGNPTGGSGGGTSHGGPAPLDPLIAATTDGYFVAYNTVDANGTFLDVHVMAAPPHLDPVPPTTWELIGQVPAVYASYLDGWSIRDWAWELMEVGRVQGGEYGRLPPNSPRGWLPDDGPPPPEDVPARPGDEVAVGGFSVRVGSSTTTITTALGTSGGDVIVSANWATAGAGNDTVGGTSAADLLRGGSGNDILTGGAGADALDGGSGFDLASYAAASAGVVVNLARAGVSAGDAAGDAFVSIEGLVGSAHGDILTGSSEANLIQAGAGNDVMAWSWGADTLDGGDGNDTIIYNSIYGLTVNLANNAANAGAAQGHVFWSVENAVGGSASDALIGNAWANELGGAAGNDTLSGGGGNDTLTGGWGNDTLDGGDGIDTVRYDDTPYGVTVNLVNSALNTGAAAGDVLINVENVVGSDAAADRLIGNGAANTLDGRFGHDTLDGGAGNDVLKGWYGYDTFVFSTALNASANVDFLADFYTPDDTIQLARGVFGALAGGTLAASAFTIGASATNAAQKIVYNASTGDIFYDADGSGAGAAIKFATVQLGTTVRADDFHIV